MSKVSEKVRLSATINPAIIQALDKVGEKEKVTRSFLIEKALEQWLKLRQEKELEKAYRELKEEDLKLAEQTIHAQSEALS